MPGSHEVVRRELAAFNARDIEAQLRVFAPGAEFSTPGAAGQQPANFSHIWWQAFPDARMSCDRAVAEDPVVVIEGTFTGTQVGTLHLAVADIPPTGRRVALPVVAVYEVQVGLIVSKQVYFDYLTLLRQLGVALPAAAKLGREASTMTSETTSETTTKYPGPREDHWVYLDRTWAQLLGVKRSAGTYRIRSRELLTRLARENAKPESSGARQP